MARKRKKQAIPKRIGGVKIPKPLRKSVRDLMGTQSGKAMAAEALTALAAAFVAGRFKHGATPSKAAAGDLAGVAGSSASAFRYAIGEAARSFQDAFERGKAEADARAAWPEREELASSKKSPSGPTAVAPH